MKRRNFSVALAAMLAGAIVLGYSDLKQIGFRYIQSILAWREKHGGLNERQARLDAAREDLNAIVQAEISHIKKQEKFGTLDELVSSGDLRPEMVGRHGYIYNISLQGSVISASARPTPGQQLSVIAIDVSGPGLTPVLAKLPKDN